MNKISWKYLFMCIVVANLADIDYIPGLLIGRPNQFHHQMTHSIGFAILTGFCIGCIYYVWKKRSFLKYGVLFSLIYASHLLLDFLGKDTSYPFGEQLFWPLSTVYVLSPWTIFGDIHKASSTDIFFQSLINWHNVSTILLEVAILSPIILIIKYRSKYRGESVIDAVEKR